MRLTEGEEVVKEWEYATTKQGSNKTHATLTLTNKRLVSSVQSKRKISHAEAPIEDIKGLSFSVDNTSNVLAVLCIIFGAIFAVAIFGIFLIIEGVQMFNSGAFMLEVSVCGQPTLVGGADSGVSKGNNRKIKVKINRSAVNEIADTLGACIINTKMGGEAE